MQEYRKAAELAVRPPEMLARLYWNMTNLAKKQGELGTARWAATQVLAAEAVTGMHSQFTERARKALAETGER
jgi:hypothetical protein